jgi:hypothetical protein
MVDSAPWASDKENTMAKPKPREKILQVGFRLPVKKKAIVEKRARKEGTSVQQFIENCIDICLALPDGLLEETRRSTQGMQLPVATIIANMIIKQTSFNVTWQKVFGKLPPGAMKEFKLEHGRLLTGDELLSRLNVEHERDIEKLKGKLESAAMGQKDIKLTAAEDEMLVTGL